MRLFLLFLIVFACLSQTQSQGKYWVSFTDKNGVQFDPKSYFDPHTLEKRTRLGIPLDDPTDYPLNSEYVNHIKGIVDSVCLESRWFNSLVVIASQDQVETLGQLDFVKSVNLLTPPEGQLCMKEMLAEGNIDDAKRAFLKKQIGRMKGEFFIQRGIDGRGIRIAVFDIGFNKADINPAFNHLFKENKIIKTWDFVDKDPNVYHYNSHGTQVLSCIAGKIDSLNIGLATGAEFLLARTEKNSEKFSEEENWLAAAEWADKNGADIINSSLGYTYHRYFNDQMDGKTSLVAKAAAMAAKKGILVVNAAGNSGSDDWHYIETPADVDSVLSIGGISPRSNYHIFFSSYGPTSDRRMKPNLCAFGTAVTAKNESLAFADGTSFASPLVAGFAACAWQTDRSMNNMELFTTLQQSGDLYPYFDYAHGYGVPQADFFTWKEKTKEAATFHFVEKAGFLIIQLAPGFIPEEKSKENLLFYNFQGTDYVLQEYAVINVYSDKVLRLKIRDLPKGVKLNVSYLGYYDSYLIN